MSDHVDGPRQIGDPRIRSHRSVRVHQPGKSCPHGGCRECLSLGGSNRDVLECDQSLDRDSPDDGGRALAMPRSSSRATKSIASVADSACSNMELTCEAGSARHLDLSRWPGAAVCCERRKGRLDARRSISSICGPALRSILSCMAPAVLKKRSQPVAARQCACYRHRIRYSTCARSRAKARCSGSLQKPVPIPGPPSPIGHDPPRFDWVGRPEQTNMRLNNPGYGRARTTCATCGISKLHLRLRKNSSPYSASD